MTTLTEDQVVRLQRQADAAVRAREANKHAPGVSMCMVTPHQLTELIAAWRCSQTANEPRPKPTDNPSPEAVSR